MTGAGRLLPGLDVSRETIERLETHAALLAKWNAAINLVSKSTLDEAWTRHVLDSAAAFAPCAGKPGHWVDIGSGAGFPGVVLAILAAEKLSGTRVTCIEADIRKCEFLRTVARATDAPVSVFSRRAEETPPQGADAVTARALGPLPGLLEHAHRHLARGGIAVFHKGEGWRNEVAEARETWQFSCDATPSGTRPGAALLRIGALERA